MKAVWISFAVLLAAIVICAPDFESLKTESSTTQQFVLPPFIPNAHAKSMSAVPGAIVCDNLPAVQVMVAEYSEHWSELAQRTMAGPKAEELLGPVFPAPNPDSYGCSLLPPGTAVQVKDWIVPHRGIAEVIAKRPDGNWIYGVTLGNMLSQM